MNIDQMIHFLRQIPGKLGSNSYSSLANQSDPSNVAFVRQLQREMKRQDILEVPFQELQLTVFDLETTGFYPYQGDQILSIGAVKIYGDTVLEGETFYSLVFNQQGPSEKIEALTGISKDALVEAPKIDRVLADFYQFIKSDPLVAHHANHERNFMQQVTWSVLNMRFEHRVIDTSFLTKIIDPTVTIVSLDDWCDYFGITIPKRHHALYDAVATAQVWVKSVRQLEEKGFHHLRDVYSYLARQS